MWDFDLNYKEDKYKNIKNCNFKGRRLDKFKNKKNLVLGVLATGEAVNTSNYE